MSGEDLTPQVPQPDAGIDEEKLLQQEVRAAGARSIRQGGRLMMLGDDLNPLDKEAAASTIRGLIAELGRTLKKLED